MSKNIIHLNSEAIHTELKDRRRKFTVGFDCVRITDDEKEYPHFVYK